MRRLLILVALLAACDSAAIPVDTYSSIDIGVGSESLTVWFADDTNERRSGLMGVEELPTGIDGMLFAWDAPLSATFTMKDTPMPLDIWWFDADGALTGSYEMQPCLSGDCVAYRSPGPVRWALETPVGAFDFAPGSLLSTVDSG